MWRRAILARAAAARKAMAQLAEDVTGPVGAEGAPECGGEQGCAGEFGFVEVAVDHVAAGDGAAEGGVEAGVVEEGPGDHAEAADDGEGDDRG